MAINRLRQAALLTSPPMANLTRVRADLWRHDPSGVTFRPVPGGTFRMGLSTREENALRAIAEDAGDPDLDLALADLHTMRPVRAVTVAPFLMARHPLTIAQVRFWLPDYEDDFADDDNDAAAARIDEDVLDGFLDLLPFRLPSEAQWEYAARGGTGGLRPVGDHLPTEDELLAVFDDEDRITGSENPFGLAAMGSLGEACADAFVDGYEGAPLDDTPRTGDGPRVVRGGAADLSPWQDCNEWLAMISAARGALDMFAAVRPVVPVD